MNHGHLHPLRRFVLLLLTTIAAIGVQSLLAQTFHIKGTVKEATSRKPIEAANISLLDSAGRQANLATTAANGSFTLDRIPHGSYQTIVSCVGYKPERIAIVGLAADHDLGTILLEEEEVRLDEVVVSGTAQPKADRWIYYPSDAIKGQSIDAYDILQRISLPDIQFNIADRTLSSLRNGTLQIRIDGVLSKQSDLFALQPQDVARVEYIDNPGIGYGDGVTAVILITTKRQFVGIQAGALLKEAMTTSLGSGNAYLKWVGRQDMISLKLAGKHRNVSGLYTDKEQQLRYPDRILSLETEGMRSRRKEWEGEVEMAYNRLLDERRSFFNADARYVRLWQPGNASGGIVRRDGEVFFNERLATRNRTHNVSLDLYLDKRLDNQANLLVNLTGTYIGTAYNRDYSKQYSGDDARSYARQYEVAGDHASVIGELSYKHPLGSDHWLTAGSRNLYSVTRNDYLSGSEADPEELDNLNSYTYVELGGTLRKLSYSVGGGYSYYYIRNGSGRVGYHFFRPSLSLSLPLPKGMRAQYYLYINPMSPTLSMLSEFEQPLSEYEIWMGNPRLKPYQAYANQLTLSWSQKETYIRMSAYLQYNHRPFTSDPPYYDAEREQFVYSLANQRNFIHAQLRLYASQSLFEKSLHLSGYLTLNRYINHGQAFTTTYTGLLGGLSLTYDRPTWGAQLNYRSAITTQFNETKRRLAPNLQLSAYYNVRRLRFTASVSNPFMDVAAVTTDLRSRVIQERSYRYQDYYNGLVQLSVSYTFSTGKSRRADKQFENIDTDSGVVR